MILEEYEKEEVCDNCGHSELIRLDSGALELKCKEFCNPVCSFWRCSNWTERHLNKGGISKHD